MNIINKFIAYYKVSYLSGNFPSLLSILLSNKRVLIYYGFLGDKNFGDELVFESAKKLFSSSILLPVRKRMPIHLAIFARLCKKRVSGLVIGGGTLIGPLWDKEFYDEYLAS